MLIILSRIQFCFPNENKHGLPKSTAAKVKRIEWSFSWRHLQNLLCHDLKNQTFLIPLPTQGNSSTKDCKMHQRKRPAVGWKTKGDWNARRGRLSR
jgi:hypothetical protein